jgi:hypothetical protein
MNISTESQKIKTYESEIMTLKIANELDGARGKLKRFFEKYMKDSQKIQKELDDVDAPQESYVKETEAVTQTEEERDIAKVILKTKLTEWEDMREQKRMDDSAKRETEKEEEIKNLIT